MHVLWRDIQPGSEEMEFYRKGLSILFSGITALPINLPGFFFHKALKVCSEGIVILQGHYFSLISLMVACDESFQSYMDFFSKTVDLIWSVFRNQIVWCYPVNLPCCQPGRIFESDQTGDCVTYSSGNHKEEGSGYQKE